MRETREMIINAVMRLALKDRHQEQLTLTEIALEAGISRQAIYQKHFKSVTEIFEYIHLTIDEQIWQVFEQKVLTLPPNKLYQGIAEQILPLIYQHREWLKVLYGTNIDLKWRKYLYEKYSTAAIMYLKNQPGLNSPLSQEKTVKILTDHIIAIISAWLSDEVPLHPTQFSQVFLEMMVRSPESFLRG
ncbi:TetR/AcrR family transcriptional regulator [Ligilactobacillus apodemi]|nr:TetR/AcrR family transcriptional regulator [Ligilactobacillus apodemi]MCR1901111.1 TetR/AcrR family transcriptional regulator [Ligilactobacillus apodemi]